MASIAYGGKRRWQMAAELKARIAAGYVTPSREARGSDALADVAVKRSLSTIRHGFDLDAVRLVEVGAGIHENVNRLGKVFEGDLLLG